ncbi:MAG TPA: winged helix DNA-binding domain-containing protein [Candidatus Limnocylindria bacterium]|nr:winged helix DNA-binding domain-containing protein [Candidatus Limnocylindria bacterium]
MKGLEIASTRLQHQGIADPKFRSPYEVVKWLGAMQAQDYLGALWAVGLRFPAARETDVVKALTKGSIVRTWPQRGTLHLVAPEEVRWRLSLSAGRMLAKAKSRHEGLRLDERVFDKCKQLFTDALQGGKQMTRPRMLELLEENGIAAKNQRGSHILWQAAQTGHIIFAAPEGKQQTFALLEEWVPKVPEVSRAEALARLTKSYFTSHGPATVADLAWWSDLTLTEIRQGLEEVRSELHQEAVDGITYWMRKDPAIGYDPIAKTKGVWLLPGFDEYLLGYKDRTAVLDLEHHPKVVPGKNGMFLSTVVLDGKVAGTWRRVVKKNEVSISVTPFYKFTLAQKKLITEAANSYSQFLGLPSMITF